MFDNDKKVDNNNGENVDSPSDVNNADVYIEQINELKKNTVDKATYEKVVAERNSLTKALVNEQKAPVETPKVSTVDIKQLRSDLFSGKKELSNLEYCTKAIELRDELIRTGQEDPFVPQGKKIVATDEDRAKAENVANALKHCIEVAQGDSGIFDNELQRITVDTIPTRRR